jgi:hypothetical protein
MCPECITSISTTALALVGLSTSGGIAALIAPGFFGKKKDKSNPENLVRGARSSDDRRHESPDPD